MFFGWNIFILIFGLLVSILPGLAHSAPPLEEVCQGPGLSIVNGMCHCDGLSDFIYPWSQSGSSDARLLCAVVTRSRTQCLNPSYKHPMRFIDHRCYCPVTHKFMGERLRWNKKRDREALVIATINDAVLNSEISSCQNESELQKLDPSIPLTESRTIRIEALVSGPRGGILYQVRRLPGMPWFDNSDGSAAQGTPYFGQKLLGPQLAPFFGFGTRGEVAYLPSLHVLNSGIQQINSNIKQLVPELNPYLEIPVYFYPTFGIINNEDFLWKFAYQGRIPLSFTSPDGDETLFFHDLNYHTAQWIVIPKVVFLIAQHQAQAIFELRDYFRKVAPEKHDLPQFKYFFHYFMLIKSKQLDAGSADLLLSHCNSDMITRSAAPLTGRSHSTREFILKYGHQLVEFLPEKSDQEWMKNLLSSFDSFKSQDRSYTDTFSFVDKEIPPIPANLYIHYKKAVIDRIQQLESFLSP